jgi:hypothetical protein
MPRPQNNLFPLCEPMRRCWHSRSSKGRQPVATSRWSGDVASAAARSGSGSGRGRPRPVGFAVPCPGRRPQVVRRHYDRLWLWPTLRVAGPVSRQWEAGWLVGDPGGVPVWLRHLECERGFRKTATAGARLSAPYGLPGRHSNERPPPLRLCARREKKRKETKTRMRERRENEHAYPLLRSSARKRGP